MLSIVSSGLDQHSDGPDLGPSCLQHQKSLQAGKELVYIRRPLFVFLVQLTIFGICFLPLGYLLLGHLLSG